MEVMDKYGADLLRYYLCASPVMKADNINFSEKDMVEQTRFFNILLNVYRFYETYTIKDDEKFEKEKFEKEKLKVKNTNILDKWIIARLNQLKEEVTENMDKYNLQKAIRPIEGFISDFSTWYIRRNRDNFENKETINREFKPYYQKLNKNHPINEEYRKLTMFTTGYVLLELSKIMAPFMPFMAEQIWQKVTGNDFKDKNKSVHLESWPDWPIKEGDDVAGKKKRGKIQRVEKGYFFDVKVVKVEDEKIIKDMEATREAVRLGLSARDLALIKVKQPLSLLYLDIRDFNYMNPDLIDLVKDEVNIKDVQPISDQSGKIIKRERGKVEVKNGKYKGKYAQDKDGANFVSLKLDLTPELIAEGTKREIVRFINAMRNKHDFTIEDRINVFIIETRSDVIKKVVNHEGQYYNEILRSVLAYRIAGQGLRPEESDEQKFFEETKINGEPVTIGIQRIFKSETR